MSVTPTSSSSTPQHRSTPQPQASPTPSPLPSASTSKSAKLSGGQAGHGNEKKNNKARNVSNVFTNDGSFLERFQRSKKEDDEKKKTDADVLRKRTFDERFKNRGKRPAPDEPPPTPLEDPPLKKIRGEKDVSLTQYEKEVKIYAGRSLKDDGIGVRPLVK